MSSHLRSVTANRETRSGSTDASLALLLLLVALSAAQTLLPIVRLYVENDDRPEIHRLTTRPPKKKAYTVQCCENELKRGQRSLDKRNIAESRGRDLSNIFFEIVVSKLGPLQHIRNPDCGLGQIEVVRRVTTETAALAHVYGSGTSGNSILK